MTVPRVITEDLGGSPLARAARGGALPQWYDRCPGSAREWKERAAAVSGGSRGWLEALGGALNASGAAAERLWRVAKSGGVMVTTGQQPGLFGGPVMTFAKALTALALADAIERATGVAAAPVFWAATDDADFDEGANAHVAVTGGVQRLRLERQAEPGTPMSNVPLGDPDLLLRALVGACGSVSDESVLDATRLAYRAGATVGGAYVELLRAILHPLGMAVLDASHSDVRRAAGGVTTRALERASAVSEALSRRDAEIRTAGFTPQVEDVPGLSMVFTLAKGTKRRLTIAESAQAARSDAADLSPNVLLRPIVERAILPTVAYVGGPGEVAYFAQVSAVADVLEAARPLIVPRWSVTVVEPRVARVLERLGASPDDLRDVAAVEGRIAREALPAPVSDALRTLREQLLQGLADVEVADASTLVPPASIQGLRGAIAHRLDRFERRYLAAVKRRQTQAMTDVATARGSLYPGGARQERVLCFVQFLARYGPALVDEMRGHAAGHAASLVGIDTTSIVAPAGQPSPA